MAFPDPPFDSRNYRDLLTDAVARIPVHTPEWTNFTDSDPGITLLQLFAFLSESVIYRANRIPERNRRKFLHLLGIPLAAARPATGLVAFGINPGVPAVPVLLDRETEVRAGSVPFRTLNGLAVLPIESRMYYKSQVTGTRRQEIQQTYERLYASIRQPLQELQFYETRAFAPPAAGAQLPAIDLAGVLDRSLWIALLARTPSDVEAARAAIAGGVLTLGIAPALDAEGKTLFPVGKAATSAGARLLFEHPDVTASTATYLTLDVLSSDDVLASPGLVQLQLPDLAALRTWDTLGPLLTGTGGYPPSIEDSDTQNRLISWLRVRTPQSEAGTDSTAGAQATAVLSWVGVNAARIEQRTRTEGERLPDGNGEPGQVMRLTSTPVIGDSIALNVNGEFWLQVDDLSEAGPEVPPRAPRLTDDGSAAESGLTSKAFTLDPATGEIRFGDGIRGARPPKGALIVAFYDVGGGRRGIVGIGAVKRPPDTFPDLTVINPLPTWGGSDAETVADAEFRIPRVVRHRNRLMSVADFAEITRETPGVDVGRVEVLPLFDPDEPGIAAHGAVTVVVIPAYDPFQPDAPRPDRLFLETVCAHLEPRRLVTTELHITGPDYQPIAVAIGIQAMPGQSEAQVREQVRATVFAFLSPLYGGFDGAGWPLGKTVELLEVQAAATRVPGVAKVNGVVMADGSGTLLPTGLALSGIQLPRVTSVRVATGNPPSLGPAPATGELPALPVPVPPDVC